MEKKELIATLIENVRIEVYKSVIFDSLAILGFDSVVMSYDAKVSYGKALGFSSALCMLTDNTYHDILLKSFEDVYRDKAFAGNDIVKLLDLVGFDGQSHYDSVMSRN